MPRMAQSAYLQVLNGNPNNKTKKELNKRLKNEKKLSVSADNMKPPAWLTTGAKKEFNRIVNLFKDTDALNEADIEELTLYCDLLSEYKAANTRLKKNGRTIKGKPNPDLRLKLQLAGQIDKIANKLALTPASRASLAIKDIDKKGDSDDDDFE